MHVPFVRCACPYSVHTPCMYTEAIYTVDKERVPKLPTGQELTNYHPTKEAALSSREKAIPDILDDITQTINHLSCTLFQRFGRCNLPRGAKTDVPACSCPNCFSLVPWNAGMANILLDTDWIPLQSDIGSLECITVARTLYNRTRDATQRGMRLNALHSGRA